MMIHAFVPSKHSAWCDVCSLPRSLHPERCAVCGTRLHDDPHLLPDGTFVCDEHCDWCRTIDGGGYPSDGTPRTRAALPAAVDTPNNPRGAPAAIQTAGGVVPKSDPDSQEAMGPQPASGELGRGRPRMAAPSPTT